MFNPKISVITVTLNSDKYLEHTIQSVKEQTYKNMEYIIIDGGSTDSTLDILSSNEKYIDIWITGKDEGIADAMNRGINLASGDYVIFIQSDDYLYNKNSIKEAANYLQGNDDILVCKVSVLDKDKNNHITNNKPLCFLTNFKMGSCHQGQIISRNLLVRLGMYDTNFKLSMDYDFLLRAYRNNASSKSANIIIATMREGGISSRKDWKSLRERFKEEKRIHLKYCKNHCMKYLYMIYWALYPAYRWCKSTLLS